MCPFICGVGVRAGGARAPGAPYVAGPEIVPYGHKVPDESCL